MRLYLNEERALRGGAGAAHARHTADELRRGPGGAGGEDRRVAGIERAIADRVSPMWVGIACPIRR